MKKDITEELLIRYILEEANAEERRQVETWLQADSKHAKHFEQTKFILDSSKRLAKSSPLPEQEAWEKFQIKRDNAKTASIRPLKRYSRLLQVAAAVLLLAAGSWAAWYYVHPQSNQWVTLTAYEKVFTDTLPDGSVIQLNKHSAISYSGRTVKLNGEAFFKVVHNISRPFTVHVQDVTIKDIGTAFNVKSNEERIEVIVESGEVRVNKKTNYIDLKPKQMVYIKSGNSPLQIENNNDRLYEYYRTNEFVADHTPLGRLITVLNEAYETNIQIEGKDLAELPVTATFKKEPLNKILQVLLLTTPEIHRVNRGNEIILTK